MFDYSMPRGGILGSILEKGRRAWAAWFIAIPSGHDAATCGYKLVVYLIPCWEKGFAKEKQVGASRRTTQHCLLAERYFVYIRCGCFDLATSIMRRAAVGRSKAKMGEEAGSV